MFHLIHPGFARIDFMKNLPADAKSKIRSPVHAKTKPVTQLSEVESMRETHY